MNCTCEPASTLLCDQCEAAILQAEEDMRAEDAHERSAS